MILKQTSGYARKRDVPGDRAKPCVSCGLWFSPRPYERVCDDCVSSFERSKRLAKVKTRGTPKLHERAAGQRGSYSEVLGLFFRPGVSICKQLAVEAAALQIWSPPRPKTHKRRATVEEI